MTEGEVRRELRTYLNRYLPAGAYTDSDDLYSLGFINSTLSLELAGHVEQQYRFTVPPRERVLVNFRSIDAMTELIMRNSR
jgi:hypothetical protein